MQLKCLLVKRVLMRVKQMNSFLRQADQQTLKLQTSLIIIQPIKHPRLSRKLKLICLKQLGEAKTMKSILMMRL